MRAVEDYCYSVSANYCLLVAGKVIEKVIGWIHTYKVIVTNGYSEEFTEITYDVTIYTSSIKLSLCKYHYCIMNK